MKEQQAWEIIENPHLTEKAMNQVEKNQLVLMVDVDANKTQIQQSVETLFDVDVQKVNTTITPQAKKKAFIRLSESDDAMDIATKLGMM